MTSARTTQLSVGGLVLAVAVVGCLAQVPDASPLDWLPDTTDTIVPFADQLGSGYSDRLVQFVATHYAGTQKMIAADNNRFRAINPRWLLLHYRLGASSGPAPYIHDNRWTSDWPQVTAHETWFLHNDLGARHHDPESNWDLHDISNAEFRAYWINSVIADMRATGAQGVFADSFDAGVSGYGITPPDARFADTAPIQPAAWPGGATWLDQKRDFINQIADRFQATPEHFLFVPNLAGLMTAWWWLPNARLDGAMFEGFPMNSPLVDWRLGLNRALELTRAGKFVIVQAYPKTVTERQFLVASYLLIKGRRTFINAAGGGVYYFPEYTLTPGPPIDPLPTDISAYEWHGIYKREFRDLVVLVNPTSESVSVDLSGPYSLVIPNGGGRTGDAELDSNGHYIGGTLAYQDVSSLVLPARSSALLRRPQ